MWLHNMCAFVTTLYRAVTNVASCITAWRGLHALGLTCSTQCAQACSHGPWPTAAASWDCSSQQLTASSTTSSTRMACPIPSAACWQVGSAGRGRCCSQNNVLSHDCWRGTAWLRSAVTQQAGSWKHRVSSYCCSGHFLVLAILNSAVRQHSFSLVSRLLFRRLWRAGAASGAIYRSPRGPRSAVIAAGLGAVAGTALVAARQVFPAL